MILLQPTDGLIDTSVCIRSLWLVQIELAFGWKRYQTRGLISNTWTDIPVATILSPPSIKFWPVTRKIIPRVTPWPSYSVMVSDVIVGGVLFAQHQKCSFTNLERQQPAASHVNSLWTSCLCPHESEIYDRINSRFWDSWTTWIL